MKRKLRIVIDAGDTFCAGCVHAVPFFEEFDCRLFGARLRVAGESKPKRCAECLQAEGMR